ncbi:hypothetical protein BGW37DRAFT_499600 [Umbelopsis sp. PMI_123]|nr:hypothetical protein BGW37DRAFT_499600 [Umbelopsis sp. PMI_123]
MIVFGNAMFNKDGVPMRGQRVGVTNILWKTLKRRERQGHLVAITIDEYLTSQICNHCRNRTLQKVKTADGVSHHNINAAKNMYGIAMAMWTDGCRPNELARPQQEIAAQNAVSL